MEDMPETPPQDIDPYTTLNLTPTATVADIKTAYRKLALKHHPDKAPSSEKSTAHTTFQAIAFAYAILSSPHRRQLYDTTGSTSETLADADDDFNWLSFFRTQYSALSASTISNFSSSYKSSPEERKDVLAAYTKHKGKWAKMYEEVLLSNPLEDEDRFRACIDEAIKKGEVEAYDAYVNESKRSKDARMKKARREAEDAEKEAKDNARYQSIFGGDGKGGRSVDGSAAADEDAPPQTNGVGSKKKKASTGKGDISDLAAMIQSRQQTRSNDILENLEAKYGGGSLTGKGKKRKAVEEPDEEAFERMKAKMAKAKAERDKNGEMSNSKTARGRKAKAPVVDEEDAEEEEEDGDLDLGDGTDVDGEEEEDEEEEEEVKPKRKGGQKGKTKKATAPPAERKNKTTTTMRARGREKK